MDATLFEEDQPWLTTLPEMNPWTVGCDKLLNGLREVIAELSADLLFRQLETTEHLHYGRPLWCCWKFHWNEAIQASENLRIDGFEGWRNLRDFRSFDGARRYSQNILADVFLGAAVLQGEKNALDRFSERFRGWVNDRASQLLRQPDLEDVWVQFFHGHLEPTKANGRLAVYHGTGGLQSWVRTTAGRFLLDWRRRETSKADSVEQQQLESMPGPESSPVDLVDAAELLNHCMEKLGEKEQQGLRLLSEEVLNNAQIAADLQMSPGNWSRTRERAFAQLRRCMEASGHEV
ncbi:MAG: RNA polymerase sigma factor [Gemmataceae bacterium]